MKNVVPSIVHCGSHLDSAVPRSTTSAASKPWHTVKGKHLQPSALAARSRSRTVANTILVRKLVKAMLSWSGECRTDCKTGRNTAC